MAVFLSALVAFACTVGLIVDVAYLIEDEWPIKRLFDRWQVWFALAWNLGLATLAWLVLLQR